MIVRSVRRSATKRIAPSAPRTRRAALGERAEPRESEERAHLGAGEIEIAGEGLAGGERVADEDEPAPVDATPEREARARDIGDAGEPERRAHGLAPRDPDDALVGIEARRAPVGPVGGDGDLRGDVEGQERSRRRPDAQAPRADGEEQIDRLARRGAEEGSPRLEGC